MKKILFFTVLVLLIAVFVRYLVSNKSTEQRTDLSPVNSEPTPATTEQFIKNIPDTSDLKAGGNSHLSPKGEYLFLYPNDYTIDGDEYTRIYKRGATQKGQTEIYDGVIVVFQSVNLDGESLAELTRSKIEGLTPEEQPENLSPTPTMLGNYPGFTYEQKGFGSSTHLIVQKNTTSNYALHITFSVNDPQNQNYLNEVHKILSTIELLK